MRARGKEMFQIVDLVKPYDKGANALRALDHINLTLPDKGLVFILGKSGCGKSTLLNMLGGLDDVTSGKVIYDGVDLSTLGEQELNNYRNNYVGIIYQNFNLFEKETVYDNVYVAGRRKQKAELEKKIDGLLQDLSLEGKKHALIKNLSGGQKQRVAIARALVKDSRVILADEPTGNLDSRNTKLIFDILKKAAEERLVVVVSHDVKSAEAYADRIIYLSDGTVVGDVTRNETFRETDSTVIDLPAECELSEERIAAINESLSADKLELRKDKGKFCPTENAAAAPEAKADVKTREKNAYTPLAISGKFLKGTYLSFIFSSLLVVIIIALLAFSVSMINFDTSGAISMINETYDAKAYILKKSFSPYNDPLNVSKGMLYEVGEGDAAAFIENGYTGAVYPIYDVSLDNKNTDDLKRSGNDLYDSFYSSGGLGVAVVNEEYLKATFGDLTLLAGSLYGLDKSDAIVVTDYFADSVINNSKYSTGKSYVSDDPNDPYQKVVNRVMNGRYKIGAVIKTDYKEKYAELIDLYTELAQDPQRSRDLKKTIYEHPLLNYFAMEVNTTLNLGYSLNPNYESALLALPDDYYFTRVPSFTILDKPGAFLASSSLTYPKMYSTRGKIELSRGEMSMARTTYNTIFGKSVNTSKAGFEEQEITLQLHKPDEPLDGEPFMTLRLKVVDVYDSGSDKWQFGYFNDEDYLAIKGAYFYPYALLFDDPYQCYSLTGISTDLYYYSDLSVYSPVFTVCQIIDVFSDVFKFIFIALIVIVAVILLLHDLRVIKKSRYLIGVYKSMGYPSGAFSAAAVLDSVYMNAAIYALSVLLSYFSTKLVNSLLTESFAELFNEPLIASLTLVGFSFPLVSVFVAIIFGLSSVVLLAAFVAIRRLRPNNILHKAVE